MLPATRQRRAQDAAALWRFRRVVDRAGAIDDLLADYATSWCRRPLRRRVVEPLTSAIELPGVVWAIDGDVMVELLVSERGPSQVVVRELALVGLLRKRLRSRYFRVVAGSPRLGRTPHARSPSSRFQ